MRARGMPLALITGAARANSIAAGIVLLPVADSRDVATSDLTNAGFPAILLPPMVVVRLARGSER